MQMSLQGGYDTLRFVSEGGIYLAEQVGVLISYTQCYMSLVCQDCAIWG